MRIQGLFILAFAVVTAALIKSQIGSDKKNTVKNKSSATAAPQWPGVMKKNTAQKLISQTGRKLNGASAVVNSTQNGSTAKVQKRVARGIASVGGGGAAAAAAGKAKSISFSAVDKFSPKGYSSSSFYYGVKSPQTQAAQARSARQAALSDGNDMSAQQELSSFTRTPDLSINVSLDPELADSFEDQVRKFREQNLLTSQDMQELEVIINNFISMSNSVQRGQVPMQQVNAEAIKITRSFINLKRRVQNRSQ